MEVNKYQYEIKDYSSSRNYFPKIFKSYFGRKKKNGDYNSDNNKQKIFNNISKIQKIKDKHKFNKKLIYLNNKLLNDNKNTIIKDCYIERNLFYKKIPIKSYNSTNNIFTRNPIILDDGIPKNKIYINEIENNNYSPINKYLSRNKNNLNLKNYLSDIIENNNIYKINNNNLKIKRKLKKIDNISFFNKNNKLNNKNKLFQKHYDKYKKYNFIMNNLRLKFHGNILFSRKLTDLIVKENDLYLKRETEFIKKIEKDVFKKLKEKESNQKSLSFNGSQKYKYKNLINNESECKFSNEMIKNCLSKGNIKVNFNDFFNKKYISK